MSENAPLLQINGLSVDYRTSRGTVQAVQNVTLGVARGHAVGLVGESGSGKSTVAAAILRLLPANAAITAGSVVFAGTNLAELSERELNRLWRWRQLATVFQKSLSALSPVHRAGSQLHDVLALREPGLDDRQREERVATVLRAVQLPERVLHAYPFELSGGMMQRTMIALGLLCTPPFLILDEATTALDVITQAQILREVNRLKSEFALTTMVISHDVGVISATVDTVAVLYAGQLMEVAPKSRFFGQPAHPYSRALVASVPRLGGQPGRLAGIPGNLPDLQNPPPGCRFAPRCPHATTRCTAAVPPLYDVGNGQAVRCVLYDTYPEQA
jgi:peptide/nickel transport system ATP-binding protein